jgi:hypothetical protein
MSIHELIFLPGIDKQLEFLLNKFDLSGKKILVAGSNTEKIVKKLSEKADEVFIIVDNEEDLSGIRFNLTDAKNIQTRLMDFTNTDFIQRKFDLIYSQGSVTRKDRNKIFREFKKIINDSGLLCIGEIISLTEKPPQFIKDIWNNSNLSPITEDKLTTFYNEKNFIVHDSKDLTSTLKEFYLLTKKLLQEKMTNLSDEEAKIYKRQLNQIKHESDVYLKLGGDKFMGFKVYLLKLLLT